MSYKNNEILSDIINQDLSKGKAIPYSWMGGHTLLE